MQEARAYGLVLEGEVAEAIELLEPLADLTPQYCWEREMVDRAAESRSILQRGEADDLRNRLEGWRLETRSALKVVPE